MTRPVGGRTARGHNRNGTPAFLPPVENSNRPSVPRSVTDPSPSRTVGTRKGKADNRQRGSTDFSAEADNAGDAMFTFGEAHLPKPALPAQPAAGGGGGGALFSFASSAGN